MAIVEPHTSTWFAITDRADRAFGRSVRANIACEGSRDICTICGFPPIGDFKLVEAVTLRRTIPSLRLCDCCLVIRQAAGDMLVPQGGGPERPATGHRVVLGIWRRVAGFLR